MQNHTIADSIPAQPQVSSPPTATIERARLRKIEGDAQNGFIFCWEVLELPDDAPTGTIVRQHLGCGKRSGFAQAFSQITGSDPASAGETDWRWALEGVTCRIAVKRFISPLGFVLTTVTAISRGR